MHRYTSGPDDNPETAHALALFGAKYAAVFQCAQRLRGIDLLMVEPNRKRAIFCLVADRMQYKLIEQRSDPDLGTYFVKISSTLDLVDYTEAASRNASLHNEEQHYQLREELEPSLSGTIAPAFDLSRAYRYISQERWRMAIIYMDRLEVKYPHWGILQLAKATAYLKLHERKQAMGSLKSACNRGIEEACQKIRTRDRQN